eukprot:Skav235177  [mRNA]  locus=scaffold721:256070:257979:- [translate_table: standard]
MPWRALRWAALAAAIIGSLEAASSCEERPLHVFPALGLAMECSPLQKSIVFHVVCLLGRMHQEAAVKAFDNTNCHRPAENTEGAAPVIGRDVRDAVQHAATCGRM